MATWQLTIFTADIRVTSPDGVQPLIVEGDGPVPTLVVLTPPVVVTPAPVGDPLAPQPGEDTSAFVFPTDGPRYSARDVDRFYALDRSGTPGGDYYSVEQDAGSPANSHANAGIAEAGAVTAYGRPIGGLRVWVRVKAGETMTGEPLLPAPGHLVRRALKRGHL